MVVVFRGICVCVCLRRMSNYWRTILLFARLNDVVMVFRNVTLVACSVWVNVYITPLLTVDVGLAAMTEIGSNESQCYRGVQGPFVGFRVRTKTMNSSIALDLGGINDVVSTY